MKMQPKICFIPRLTGIGGMVSFQSKFTRELSRRGIQVSYDLSDPTIDSILVIGGTRYLGKLRYAKHHGIRIVQRLDGMNWIHRKINTGAGHWLRAEYGNLILSIIRSHLVDAVAYQSEFSKEWWEREKGITACQNCVIYNGVDLHRFTPGGAVSAGDRVLRILMVEGSLLGGYEFGLENAVHLANQVAQKAAEGRQVELWVVGKVSSSTKDNWENWLSEHGEENSLHINWLGTIDHEMINEIYQQSHLLFSADINAACPNSVIESLASGTPVIAFDTGALKEIVGDSGGSVVPYGGNSWRLEKPDIPALAESTWKILENLDAYQKSARQRAESVFGLELMVDQYLDLLLG
jgi:glycosyltransferase involved in cell wall biosynthesis